MVIVVAVDFSDVVQQLLEEAVKLALNSGATVYLLHTVDPEPDFVGYQQDPKAMRDELARQYQREHRMVQEYAEKLRSQGVETTAVLARGDVCDTILHEAEKVSADLIMVASHGQGLLANIVLGSTCQQLIRTAKIPVVVVPAERIQP